MKALAYRGPGKKALDDRPMPEIATPTDAIVKITKTTICGTDLHILKGDGTTVDLHLERLWLHNITITTACLARFPASRIAEHDFQ